MKIKFETRDAAGEVCKGEVPVDEFLALCEQCSETNWPEREQVIRDVKAAAAAGRAMKIVFEDLFDRAEMRLSIRVLPFGEAA